MSRLFFLSALIAIVPGTIFAQSHHRHSGGGGGGSGMFNSGFGGQSRNTGGNLGGIGNVSTGKAVPRAFAPAPNTSGQVNTGGFRPSGGGGGGGFFNDFNTGGGGGGFQPQQSRVVQSQPAFSQPQSFSQPSFSQPSFSQPQTFSQPTSFSSSAASFQSAAPQVNFNSSSFNNSPSFSAPPPQQQFSNLPIVIRCHSQATSRCAYRLIESTGVAYPYSIKPGKKQVFNENSRWQLEFDRGNGEAARYTLSGGEIYELRQEPGGWTCYLAS